MEEHDISEDADREYFLDVVNGVIERQQELISSYQGI